MDAREALERLGRCIGAAFSRRADILFMAHDAAARERDKDNEALAVLRKVVEAQERHDEAGGGIETWVKKEMDISVGALNHEESPAESHGLSIDDERAIKRLERCIRDLESSMLEKGYRPNPYNKVALSHLRSRLSGGERWQIQTLTPPQSAGRGDQNE